MIAGIYTRRTPNNNITKLRTHFNNNDLFRPFPYDSKGHWQNNTTLLLQQDRFNSPQSHHENGPIHNSEASLTITAWATLYNRKELYDKLQPAQPLATLSDTELILKCYQKWQHNCVDHLIGDYAFVIVDTKAQNLFCARDPMGIRPFYYQLNANQFSFASSMGCFKYMPDCDMNPSQKWMADFMTGLSKSWDETPYPQIQKLPPAHVLIVKQDNHNCFSYFTFNGEQTTSYQSSEDAVAAYRQKLDRAVVSRFDSDYPLGFELSGGLDSSTLVCYANKFLSGERRRQVQAFGHISCEQEPAFIHAVSSHCNISATHIMPVDPQQDAAALRAITILGYPIEHGSSFSSEPFYRLARQQGIRTLFSGHGGDEFTTTNGALVLPQLYYQRRWHDMYIALKGNTATKALRALKLVQRLRRTRKQKYNPGFINSFKPRWQQQVVQQDLVQMYDLENRYLDTARFDAGYQSLNDFTLGNRWAPFGPTRTETGTLMAAARGVEYRWPLLDHHLIQHFLSTPVTEKYYCGIGRYLHKRAVDDIMPQMVTWKPSKYMGEPSTSGRFKKMVAAAGRIDVGDLHPMLKELVDTDKLAAQQKEMLANQEGKIGDPRLFQQQRNMSNLHWLDIWLKEYIDP